MIGFIQLKKTKNNLFLILKDFNQNVLAITSFGILGFFTEKRKSYYSYYMLSLNAASKAKKFEHIKFWNLEFLGNCLHKKAVIRGFINNAIFLNVIVFKDLILHGGCKLKKKRRG